MSPDVPTACARIGGNIGWIANALEYRAPDASPGAVGDLDSRPQLNPTVMTAASGSVRRRSELEGACRNASRRALLKITRFLGRAAGPLHPSVKC